MVDFDETNFLTALRNKVISGILVEEELNDQQITEQRRDTCSLCDQMDTENVTCKLCGCFLAIKTKSKVNINHKTGKSEITHCPLNKWQDIFSQFYFTNLNN